MHAKGECRLHSPFRLPVVAAQLLTLVPRSGGFTVWLVRSIFIFLVIAAALVFAIGNVENKAPEVRVFTRTYQDVHLSLIVLSSAVFGGLVCFLIMIFREFGLRNSIRKLRRENMRLDDELTALRNLPLTGLPAQGGPPEASA